MNNQQIGMLFTGDMVRAIIYGIKTVTRRTSGLDIPNTDPDGWNLEYCYPTSSEETAKIMSGLSMGDVTVRPRCPYGSIGTIIYGRENFCYGGGDNVIYQADRRATKHLKWKPSIHLPRIKCRIWLEVEEIRLERLLSITEDDALAEGIDQLEHNCYRNYMVEEDWEYGGKKMKHFHFLENPIGSYMSLWDSINGSGAHKSNPWLWVVKFKVLSVTGKPEDL